MVLHYEVEVNGSTTTATKYYFFNNQRVAMKEGSGSLVYLNGDHLSSTALATTNTGAFLERQGYYGYGKYRTGGVLPTDNRYTGQKLDATTGLYYYGARYYDRNVGMFISPDTLVPDPTNVWDYNRYLYGNLNPLKYNDPTGHMCNMMETMGFDSVGFVVDCLVGGGGGGGGLSRGEIVALGAAGGIGAAVALNAGLATDAPPSVASDVPSSTVHGDPLPVAAASSTSFPLADGGPATSIPASTGMFNNTLNVLTDPLPVVDPTGHVYGYTSQLDKNMHTAGIVRPTNAAAHHIVAANARGAARSQSILQQAGVSLDDAVNGVYLPANRNVPNPTGANVHSTLHTLRYYQEVESRLANRGNQSVQSVLQQIRQELQNGTFPY